MLHRSNKKSWQLLTKFTIRQAFNLLKKNMLQKMRVSNCHEYNKFLQERGNIFYYVNDAIENWYEKGPKMAVGNYIYSDKVVILVHIITYLFRIGLRQTAGFIAGYLERNLQVITGLKKA
ncbi:MAG: transposase [Wolbachia endosymbiont of Homalodisca vitripennis]|nr:transposase [Wolbachia endosymbiont of Homalodisca vitripennis]